MNSTFPYLPHREMSPHVRQMRNGTVFYYRRCMKLKRTRYHIDSYILHDDGVFPNNALLPVLHYKFIIDLPALFAGTRIKNHFAQNGWTNSWSGPIYDFHHYHSHTHEVLGAYKGQAEILLGGDNGTGILFEAGDVLVIPAGVAHKRVDPKAKLYCVGAYPEGREYDMQLGAKSE